VIAVASQPVPEPSSDIPREAALPPDARRREVARLLGCVATDAAEAPAAPGARSLKGLALGCHVERECPARTQPAPRARGSRTDAQREDDQ
jgi:hypothetical protein